ncbi:MAG: tRNA epoxyqueuosine(34) reductase QueG [Deltaproteobacteria bacterium]|nr:tRNA epoxyqueuosine(34) reductase QueG [Deltaproteobacteria bacterium]
MERIGRRELEGMAAACGLDDAAAAPARPVPVDAASWDARVAGYPADLGYLARGAARRLDPDLVLPGVRSMVVAAVSYATAAPGAEALPPGHVFVSRHAWCLDYHRTVGERMERLAAAIAGATGARTRWYVDTGPVPEKAWAAAAGLGFVGRNGLLIHPRLGSFAFLGAVLTDAEVEGRTPVPDGCGSCRACADACPARALPRPYELDASRCAAFLNAACRSPVSADLLPGLASNLYGCDLCQDACPWNRRADRPAREEFRPLPGLHLPAVADVLALGEEGVRALFAPTAGHRRDPRLVLDVASRLAGGV